MKKVVRFESNDGKLFDSEQACKDYEYRKAWEEKIHDDLQYADSDEIYDWIIKNTKGFNVLNQKQVTK